MQSHNDRPDHIPDMDELYQQLVERADKMNEEKSNAITAGKDDEQPIRGWKHKGMSIQQMPDDPQGVMRLSIGGSVGFGYCTFRGSRQACLTLLRQALAGLQRHD